MQKVTVRKPDSHCAMITLSAEGEWNRQHPARKS